MEMELFYDCINNAVSKHKEITPDFSLSILSFTNYLKDIIDSDETEDSVLKSTRMLVLFEGFYKSLSDLDDFKVMLSGVRWKRWAKHYNIPTVTFLISFKKQIEQAILLFTGFPGSVDHSERPWNMFDQAGMVIDLDNYLMLDDKLVSAVEVPLSQNKRGRFLKTYNASGGFTIDPLDPISQEFIQYSKALSSEKPVVLEVGAAFGYASLQAIEKEATVFCNDIDVNNLAVISNRYSEKTNKKINLTTGDFDKVVFVPGSFPSDLKGLPENFFDAILICRVLHFFTGDQIEKALKQLYKHLKPGGKLFIVCETPYLKNWEKFIPIYESRVSDGQEWPGEITNPMEYESSGRSKALPEFVHWISEEVLEKAVCKENFYIERLSYIDRLGQFPNDLLLDGRESVGVIAVKPE
jgi:SAM-dependent methyltransferase